MSEDSVREAVHLVTDGPGRITVEAYAAPRTPGQWALVVDTLTDSLRADGADVSVEVGRWGPEVVAATSGTDLRFLGSDGPRWMVRCVIARPPAGRCGGSVVVGGDRACDLGWHRDQSWRRTASGRGTSAGGPAFGDHRTARGCPPAAPRSHPARAPGCSSRARGRQQLRRLRSRRVRSRGSAMVAAVPATRRPTRGRERGHGCPDSVSRSLTGHRLRKGWMSDGTGRQPSRVSTE
ncbi:DUF3710 domain-containing protein [Rhodococcus jostii]|uniref:DUF3710 domain-containing protein n=1 Tax=Rhodococcus jostii TaxID=132919 RepID=UPI00363B925E